MRPKFPLDQEVPLLGKIQKMMLVTGQQVPRKNFAAMIDGLQLLLFPHTMTPFNNQDRKVIKAYLDAALATVNTHKNWNFSYSQFVFPNTVGPDFSYADNTNSPGSPNAPSVFLVTTGAASNLTWSFIGTGSSTTPPQPWIDRTNELCTGGASLTQTKLYSSKMVGYNSSTTNMKATTERTDSGGLFLCVYVQLWQMEPQWSRGNQLG